MITKHPGTGGAVTVETVTAQLVYEIAAPAYLGPDVVTHLDTLRLTQEGPDRVRVTGTRGTPPPPTLKVGVAGVDGHRNAMTFVLTGLDLDAKAALVRTQMEDAVGKEGLAFTLTPTATGALLHVTIHDPDARRAGRTFSSAAVELALASYPGCTLTTPPGDATPNTVFTSDTTPQAPHWAIHPDGTRVEIPPPARTAPLVTDHAAQPDGEAVDRPRGPVGTRSGDKGADANVGVWARSEEDYAALRGWLTSERFVELLPEAASYPIERYEMPNLWAVNFVVRGVLGRRDWLDPQGKALGERLRARMREAP